MRHTEAEALLPDKISCTESKGVGQLFIFKVQFRRDENTGRAEN